MTATAAAWTGTRLGDRRREAAAILRAAGVATPWLDAGLLLAHALGMTREEILIKAERPLAAAESIAFTALIARRARREPVSHLLGRREFWSLDFTVGPDVLDPRPDSETLIESVLSRIGDRAAPLTILDLGTGSGCLLLALLHELPKASGLGRDLSAAALAVAAKNAAALGLARRCRFDEGDWGRGLTQAFDIIVANPPYLTRRDMAETAPEVRDFEPHLALDGGDDGLDAYRRLGPDILRLLTPEGFAAIEIGRDQGDPVRALFASAGLVMESGARDLAGIERCLVFRPAGATVNPQIAQQIGQIPI